MGEHFIPKATNTFIIRETPKFPKLSRVPVLINILCLKLTRKQEDSKNNRFILMNLHSIYPHLYKCQILKNTQEPVQ